MEFTLLPTRRSRIVSRLLIGLAILYGLLFGFILIMMISPDISSRDRAILLMANGLLLIWVIIGGLIQRTYRDQIVGWISRIPLDWRVRFVLLCTGMALLEEAVTTAMSNLGPLLGSSSAMITASKNYFEVVLFTSVIVFIPMYICWAWLLNRWAFRPVEVMLLYGLSGWLAELVTFGPQNFLMVGMWVYVYGLMVWLPAHTVPTARLTRRVPLWLWPVAVILPILAAIPWTIVVLIIRKAVGID